MKKFRFKLDVVLAERKRVEDQRLKDWTLAQRLLQGMYDQLHALQKRLSVAFGEATSLGALQAGNVGMLSSVESFISGQKVRIEWKSREIERAIKIVEKARLLYVTARQKREALEKLKERKFDEFKEAIRKNELKKLDDIYVMTGAAVRRAREEDEEAGA